MKTGIAATVVRQRGMVLISSLLLLIVVTILAVSMFRSFGIQEKIAGNVREKQRALQAAEAAQQYAEYWLSYGNDVLTQPIQCSGVSNANTSAVNICANILSLNTTVTKVPWQISGSEVGFTYNPGNSMFLGSSSSSGSSSIPPGANSYASLPRFYISDLGASALGANREIYRIDAWAYGGTTSTVSVIESTYEILYTSATASGP